MVTLIKRSSLQKSVSIFTPKRYMRLAPGYYINGNFLFHKRSITSDKIISRCLDDYTKNVVAVCKKFLFDRIGSF